MKYYRFPENRISKLGFFLLILALQLVARSTMFTSTILGFYKAQALMIGLVLVAGITFVFFNFKNLKQILTDRRMIVVVAITVFVLGLMVLKQDWQLMYFTMLLSIYFAIFLTYFVTLQEAAYCYVLIFFWLSAYALLGQFVMKPMVHAGILPAREMLSPGGWFMYDFGLTFAANMNIFSLDTSRMFGFFREPGLYQIFLFIAIQLNNYTVQWDKPWKMWAVNLVLFATLLATFATGGVLALGLYIVFLFFDKGLYKDKRLCILAVVLVLAGIAVLTYTIAQNGTWATELIWMIQKIFEGTDSYVDRVESVFANAEIFLKHPILGEDLKVVMYAAYNNTASSPILFAIFGIVGGCFHVASWAALAWRKERSVIMNLILMVILFVPFNTQCVIQDMFFWVFPVMAFVEKGLPWLETMKLRKKA